MFARFFTLAGMAFAVVLAVQPSARAQDANRIAAVVNDEIISIRDLDERIRAALLFTNQPDSTENRRRVVAQVLHKMVDERLQMQEANRLKINLTSAEVDNGITMIERQNRMPSGALVATLRRANIDPDSIRSQIRADLTWMRVSSRVLQSQIRVGEEEINDRLETLQHRQGLPEYLAAEIFLPVDNPDQDENARHLGENLLAQLQAGTSFQALAQQFSRSPTAANGGMMGWISDGMADDELLAILAQLSKGQVSHLVRTGSGYYLLALVDQRIAGQSIDPENSQLTVDEMILPVPTGPNVPPKTVLMTKAAGLSSQARSCADFEAMGHQVGAVRIGSLGTKRVGEFDADSRGELMSLPVGRASTPQDTPEGIRILMVCDRKEATTITQPTREQIRRNLEDERMSMLARRYIRDLRRAAFIEFRV